MQPSNLPHALQARYIQQKEIPKDTHAGKCETGYQEKQETKKITESHTESSVWEEEEEGEETPET